jgi:sugar-specific transcriptional regulator TrmB
MSEKFDKNKQEGSVKDLQKLGLGEKEAAVYLALLELGTVGSSKIIAQTGLHGQYVYAALATLEQKGLVQHAVERGRKKFSAKHPKTLVRLIDEQKRLADGLAERLQAQIILPPGQQFEVFQGVESFVAHEFELLERVPERSELLIIGGSGDQFAKTMGERLSAYETLRIKKELGVRYVGSSDQRDDLEKHKRERDFFEYRVLPGLFTGLVNTNIWPHAVGFNTFGTPVTAFVMENPAIADSYRQFFETLWNLSAK